MAQAPPDITTVIDPFAESGPVGTDVALADAADRINSGSPDPAAPAPDKPVTSAPDKPPEPGAGIDDSDMGAVLGGVTVEPAAPSEAPAAKPAAGQPDGAPEAAKPAGEAPADDFTSIKLGPHARPETTRAFEEVKSRATTQIAALKASLEAAQTKLAEFSDPAKIVTPDLEKEVAELRNLRDRIAVRGDPAFESKYSAPIAKIDEGLFAALAESGATKENLDAIRKLTFDGVDVEKLVESVEDPVKKRRLEAMFRRRDDAVTVREEAQRAAEKNATEYTKARVEEMKAEETKKVTAAIARFSEYVQADDSFKPIAVPAGAKPEQVALIQKTNKYLKDISDSTTALLKEGSSESIAKIAKAGATGFIFRARWQAAATLAKNLKAENDQLRERLKVFSNGSSTDTGPRKVLGMTSNPGEAALPFNAPVDMAFQRFEERQRNSGVS